MKKLLCLLLAVIMVVSVTVISAGAYNTDGDFSKLSAGTYSPSDSYTVDEKVPYSEDAVIACGGSLADTQKIYFQAPEDWANEFNTFAGPDDSEPYAHICAYWWSGIGSKWSDGSEVKWVGYQAHLVDKENRIYRIQMPNDGDSPMVVWNNGVNAGMDKDAPFFKYGRQIIDANTEGAYEGDFDTLPEGSPNEEDFDGCIQIIDYTVSKPNDLTGFDSYGSNWYIYYGDGCYGEYATTSDHFVSKYENCKNPEHLADPKKYHPTPGDVDGDDKTTVDDAHEIQRYIVKLVEFNDTQKKAADVDGDGFISVIDASRIQRFVAGYCDINGNAIG